jgi:hypothetical protein
MILAALGCALGVFAARWSSDTTFLSQPAATPWVVLIGANVAAWFVLVVPILQRSPSAVESCWS